MDFERNASSMKLSRNLGFLFFFGILIVFGQSSTLSPFIYALF